MKIYKNLFEEIVSTENLFLAWDKFKNGKRNKKDVRLFEWNLEENMFRLHRDLKHKTAICLCTLPLTIDIIILICYN